MPYTEEKYENAIIQLFEEMGYTHAYGPAIAWKDEVFVSWSADDGYIVEDINT